MQKQQPHHHLWLRIITGFSVLIVSVGLAWWTWYEKTNLSISTHTNTIKSLPVAQLDQPVAQKLPELKAKDLAKENVPEVYWLQDTGNHVELVPSRIQQKAVDRASTLEIAFHRLLDQPKDTNLFSAIPQGTKILKVNIEVDGVHINLSQEFTKGGGSASMIGRLGQILYTATSLEPRAMVWISVEGKPLTTLGGEGLEISQPIDRHSFDTSFQL